MVYLGMGPGACKISRHLDTGFILFQFWVGPISVVPVQYIMKPGASKEDDDVSFLKAVPRPKTSSRMPGAWVLAKTDVEQIGRESGLAMMESAKLLADSVAVMAQLSLRDTET